MALAEQDIKSLSPAEFYDLLMRVVPQETQVYLQRVVRHMQPYRSVMGRLRAICGLGKSEACASP